MNKRQLVVLSGAGVSAESGIKTFRDNGGLWENHNIEDVATPYAWRKDRELVLEFYNQRRRQLKDVNPNAAHKAIAGLEEDYNVTVITQNIDDLHERAGSSRVIHLHGELFKSRSEKYEHLLYECRGDIRVGDQCERGHQLRPHVVWFGEAVPMIETAALAVSQADIIIIVGTSMQVYPAAGLIGYAGTDVPVYYIDPNPSISWELKQRPNMEIINENATTGMEKLIKQL